MKNLYFITLFSLLFNISIADEDCSQSLSLECSKKLETKIEEIKKHYIHEEYKNDLWTVHTETFDKKNSKDWNIFASVNGKITDGDRLRIRIIPRNIESCNMGNIITTFYTYSNVKNFSDIENVLIPAYFNDRDIYVKILSSHKFLAGNMIFIDVTWNKLEDLKRFFSKKNEVSLKLMNSKHLNIDEYFDIQENLFSLEGLDRALDKAKYQCIKIVNSRV